MKHQGSLSTVENYLSLLPFPALKLIGNKLSANERYNLFLFARVVLMNPFILKDLEWKQQNPIELVEIELGLREIKTLLTLFVDDHDWSTPFNIGFKLDNILQVCRLYLNARQQVEFSEFLSLLTEVYSNHQPSFQGKSYASAQS